MITLVLTRLLRQGHCYIGKSKESNPTDALANTPPTHCQHVDHHFENKILVRKSSLHFFFAFLGYLTKEVSMSADTDLTDMFTFCLLARLGSKKSLLIIDF